MEIVPLQALPKQSFSIVLDNVLFQIDLIETNGCMSMNLVRGGGDPLNGLRCVAGQPTIPFEVQESGDGNFVFLTQNDELPFYESFGSTQTLVYFSDADLKALDGGV